MTTMTEELADLGVVDPDLVAGCTAYRECPRTAEWLVTHRTTNRFLCTICEHHRPRFIDVWRDVMHADPADLRIVRI